MRLRRCESCGELFDTASDPAERDRHGTRVGVRMSGPFDCPERRVSRRRKHDLRMFRRGVLTRDDAQAFSQRRLRHHKEGRWWS